MGSISAQTPSIHHHHHRNPISLCSSTLLSPPHRLPLHQRQFCVLKTKPDGGRTGSSPSSSSGSGQDGYRADMLRKPVVSPTVEGDEDESGEAADKGDEMERTEEVWVDWEDQILEDTVPLVGFVRMILHSGKYANGERLSPQHEKTILERLLPYHPECEKKIGSGVDYVTTGYHPDFETSRCLFLVRKDGELVDFSYWKCIKGLIKKNYPLYADSFILKHFRRRSRAE